MITPLTESAELRGIQVADHLMLKILTIGLLRQDKENAEHWTAILKGVLKGFQENNSADPSGFSEALIERLQGYEKVVDDVMASLK